MLAGNNRYWEEDVGWEPVGELAYNVRRRFVSRIVFERPFAGAPVVHLGLTGFDISNHDAARLEVSVANITSEGFDVVAETWLGTQIWSFSVSWFALG
jgi:hypothetical protein